MSNEKTEIVEWYHAAVSELKAVKRVIFDRIDAVPGQTSEKLALLEDLRLKALALAQIGAELLIKAVLA